MPRIGKDDGKGNREVRFYLEFDIVDRDEKIVSANGFGKYKIEMWTPGLAHSDAVLDQIYARKPVVYQTMDNVRKIENQFLVRVDRDYIPFTLEEYEGKPLKGKPLLHFTTKPIKLKIDVAEWRYDYEIWFTPSGLFKPTLYDGHKSQYWVLEDLRHH